MQEYIKMSDYDKECYALLKRNHISFTFKEPEIVEWFGRTHFMFKCRFYNKWNHKSMTVNFKTSYQDYLDGVEEISVYDVLACLQKYDCGSLSDFAHEFGYDTDKKETEEIYKACVKEYNGVLRVFQGCLEDLRNIY